MNKNTVYLNNAATSWPKPACVPEAVARALSERPGAMHRGGIEDFDIFDSVRRLLMPLLGVSNHNQIALGFNATWALNAAIFGMKLSKGDLVLTTNAEHNSILRPLHYLEQRCGVKTHFVHTDKSGRADLSEFNKAAFDYKPKLCIITHSSNVTGAVNDIAEMSRISKAAGAAVLIDASQTLGYINVCAEEISADMVAFTGHKYLLGPQGTGGLWVSENLKLEPHLIGGTGVNSDMPTMPDEMPLHLEAGTGNEPSFYGLLAALKWAGENPLPKTGLADKIDKLAEGLKEIGALVISPSGLKTPVISFNVPGVSADDVGFMLSDSYDIVCRWGLHCAPRIFPDLGVMQTLRFSLSRFTTDDEINYAISAVRDIIG